MLNFSVAQAGILQNLVSRWPPLRYGWPLKAAPHYPHKLQPVNQRA